jgi:RNA polymerase sigma factor (sigma-70 family)
MNSDESRLWKRYRGGDESARDELIILYRPLAKFWARKISMIAGWASSEDLKQEGMIGLMKAVERFDPSQGVKFKFFASPFIRGAIFDSSEFTRDLARRQKEIYRKIRRAEEELTKALERIPTIEEVADETGLTIPQIENAISAVGVAGAEELPDKEGAPASGRSETPHPERTILLMEMLSQLSEREQGIIALFYLQDQSPQQIAQQLGLTVSNVTKIRQRAIKRLGKLDVRGR